MAVIIVMENSMHGAKTILTPHPSIIIDATYGELEKTA